MEIKELEAYEIIEQRKLDDLDSVSYLLRHKKTNAKIAILSNDDNNKVFYIGFRTPPKDSTGVAHIIEHTVLCGSEKFPVKDPFIELAKGSLNTFLNAMTYPDKTVYPVASCNDKDIQNLMDVYLDAVFHPNIYNEKKIFEQEGWHYECEGVDQPITINGVVYNEMKGAFSSPDDVLDREILNSLFPDNMYGVESGGDPENIPDLTYEDYLEFHKKFYHPSNSYIYLYGDMDMAKKLDWIDKEYLSKYEAIEVDNEIPLQVAFKEPKNLLKEYPISEGESEENNTYLSYNTVVGTSLDRELYVAFQILDFALCSAPGAPIKKALIDAGIGNDVYSVYDNGVLQPYFSIVAKNANESQKEEFCRIVEEVLGKLVKEGIRKDSLLAGVNYFEFKYKEADFGSYPKGLMYGLQMFDSWLYDDNKPFIHIEANQTYQTLREKIETGYYEKLVQKYLIDNTHKAILTVVPKKGLLAEREKKLTQQLEEYKNGLTEAEIEEIVKHTVSLHEYQESEDSEQALASIPLLTRDDLDKKAMKFINEELEVANKKVLFHEIYTNGVAYMRILFPIDHISEEDLPYLALLKAMLGYVDTKNYTYGELFEQINLRSGSIVTSANVYMNSKNEKEYKLTFEISAKAFEHSIEDTLALVKEIILTSKLDDAKRIKEIISETKSRLQSYMQSAGHSVAALHAIANFSETALIQENMSGIPFYRLLEHLEQDFEERYEDLVGKLRHCVDLFLNQAEMMFDYTGSRAGLEKMMILLPDFVEALPMKDIPANQLAVHLKKENSAYLSAAQVQYVALAGNYKKEGLPYTGSLRVLKVMMGYEYLWIQVRVKGGAYGCMSSFGKNGESYFVSYRDPNLTKTLDSYKNAAEFVRNYEADERTMTQYIIGALSEKDTPLTPRATGVRSLTAYMTNYTFEDEQKERDELLNTTAEKIREMADYIDAFVKQDNICVVGNETVLKENQNLFEHIEMLFGEDNS